MGFELVRALVVLFGTGAVLILLEHRRHAAGRPQVRRDWTKYGIYVLLIAFLIGVAGWWGRVGLTVVLVVLCGVGAWEIGRARSGGAVPLVLTFVLLLAALGHLLPGEADTWFPRFAFVLLVVSTMDSFSQLWGRLLGRRRLCPRLSPGKTVEGVCGGFLTAVGVSLALGFLLPHGTPGCLIVLGALTAAGAVLGDLFFSWVKRESGIKDFSSLIPGHGGVLDRFDSLVVGAPVFFWSRFVLFS
jgi:phosphatidate cytidylyltransferase